MKISNEVKVGGLAVLAIFVFIYGYNFLKGKDIFSKNQYVYVEYDNVNYLDNAAGVFLSGFQVGMVSEIYQKKDGSQKIVTVLRLDPGVKIPKTTVARIISSDPLGGPSIRLEYDTPCSGDNCVKSGDYIRGEVSGLIESLLGDGQLESYIDQARDALTNALDSVARKMGLSGENGDDLQVMKDDFSMIVSNFKGITTSLDNILRSTSKDIEGTMGNLNSLTKNLSDNNQQIADILANSADFTRKLSEANLDSALIRTTAALDGVTETLNGADATIEKLDKLLYELNYGEGSAALMINDPQIYNNLNNSLRDLSFLLKDFRLNPKRYVNVSVFGKKSKEYQGVEGDPEGKQIGENPKVPETEEQE